MSRTAEDEWIGASRDAAISSGDYTVPLPSGVSGAARFLALRPASPGSAAVLPDARQCTQAVGGLPAHTIANLGAEVMTVENQAGATIATLAVNQVAQCWLIDASTAAGVWIARTTTSAVSSALANAVDLFTLTISNQNDVNIRAMCDAQGYAGTLPARVAVTLRANHIIGSTSNLTPAFDTGTFPALSVITLTVGANSYICGKGGDGGPPGSTVPIIAASNGASGGQSMQVDTDLVLVNYGKIQGGGGGGGGGAGDAGITTTIGARSGGGAGHTIGNGGALPSQIVYPALNGGIESPGVGETIPTGQTGGSGGGPGAAGTAASTGGAGGAAGSAIESKAASPGVLTKLVAGTIDGAEVVT